MFEYFCTRRPSVNEAHNLTEGEGLRWRLSKSISGDPVCESSRRRTVSAKAKSDRLNDFQIRPIKRLIGNVCSSSYDRRDQKDIYRAEPSSWLVREMWPKKKIITWLDMMWEAFANGRCSNNVWQWQKMLGMMTGRILLNVHKSFMQESPKSLIVHDKVVMYTKN